MKNLLQHTLAKKVNCVGIGLHSGEEVKMSILPAPTNHGIVFVRTDIEGIFDPIVKADFRNVCNTNLGTSLTNSDGTIISTVEHLMAAFWGCNIDNAIVEVSGPEIPIMDGSAEPFVFLIECADIKEQNDQRRMIKIIENVEIKEENRYVYIEPAESFSVSLEIDYGENVIAKQNCVFHSSDISFKKDLCRARTFGFEHEVSKLREIGLARGGSLDNAIVIGKEKVLNQEGLRYNDEFVRHKILDCIGDFYLAGYPIQGHLYGYRSGHELNNRLLHKIFSETNSWQMVGGIPS